MLEELKYRSKVKGKRKRPVYFRIEEIVVVKEALLTLYEHKPEFCKEYKFFFDRVVDKIEERLNCKLFL